LPVLELPSNAAFRETALLGALALQANRIRAAAHIYEEVNFGTSNVTALVCDAGGFEFRGVHGASICLMLLVFDATVLHEADLSYLFTMKSITSELAKVLIGTFFGCWGGVVSLLLRLPDFENIKGKSRTFLRASGGTRYWRNFCVRPWGAHFGQNYQH